MKEFIKKNKKLILAGAIIAVFTVLLCVSVTLKILVQVFGYAAYFYLLVAYALFVLACKKKKLPVTKKRLGLYIAAIALLIMTLHVGLCGKALVESGAGRYIGGSYDSFTVGGVLFSLLSLPVVLICKFIASVIIYFVATAVCGFFVIAPLVFEPSEKPEKKKTETKPVEAKPAESVRPTQIRDIPTTVEPAVAVSDATSPDKDSKEYAKRLLFGDTPIRKQPTEPEQPKINIFEPTPEPTPRPAVPAQPKAEPQPDLFAKKTEKTGTYKIIDGVDALFVPPDITPYTNSYLNQREEAKNKLFNNYSITDDYAGRSQRLAENSKTVGDGIKDSMKVNPYIPSETVFETPEPKEIAEPEAPTVEAVPRYTAPAAPEKTAEKEFSVDESGEIVDVLPTVKDSPFASAIRADKGEEAPVNVYTSYSLQTPKPTPVPPPVKKPEPIPEPEEEKPESEEEDPSVIKQFRLTKPYAAPPVSILDDHVKEGFSPYVENFAELKEVFEVKLKNYGIDATLVDVVKGPTVTLCVIDLSEKCTINKVLSVEKDIERLLKTPQGQKINILTKLPNSTYFGIEVPNTVKGVVSFKEVMASPEWNNSRGGLALGLGKTNSGEIVVKDLADMPHALIAGSSGSGKSVCINAIIASLLFRYSPDELKLILIDLKFVEMANFAELPHMLFKNPLNEVPEVINALNWLKAEASRRFMTFKDMRCRNLAEYNKKVPQDKQMPKIVMIIDEASELMTHPTGRKTMESALSSLARVARAAGIHMLFATQTPSKDVITSEIQNNMTTKIAFAVSDYVQSQVIFKSPEAAKLLGKGDMMIKETSGMTRAQCALVTTAEIDRIVEYIKDNNRVEFDEDAIERILHGSKEEAAPQAAPVENKEVKPVGLLEKKNFDDDAGFQELVKESLRIFVTTGKVSATYIQRRFAKGYNTIANVMDYLESKGYVSEPVNNKRSLLITKEKFYEIYPECAEEEEI